MKTLTKGEIRLVASARAQHGTRSRWLSIIVGFILIAIAFADYVFSLATDQTVDICRVLLLLAVGGSGIERPRIVSTISKLSHSPELDNQIEAIDLTKRRIWLAVLFILSVIGFWILTYFLKS